MPDTALPRNTAPRQDSASRQNTQDRILAAAAKQFREQGYTAAKTRGIAAAAGVLPGTLHYWFPTKYSILLCLTERTINLVLSRIEKAISQSSNPGKRLRLALRAYLDLLLSGNDAMTVLVFEFRSLTNEHRAEITRLRDRLDKIWDGLLREAESAGQLRPGLDPSMIRLFGMGAIHWTLQWYSARGKYSPQEIAEMYADFFAGGAFVHVPVTEQQPYFKSVPAAEGG